MAANDAIASFAAIRVFYLEKKILGKAGRSLMLKSLVLFKGTALAVSQMRRYPAALAAEVSLCYLE